MFVSDVFRFLIRRQSQTGFFLLQTRKYLLRGYFLLLRSCTNCSSTLAALHPEMIFMSDNFLIPLPSSQKYLAHLWLKFPIFLSFLRPKLQFESSFFFLSIKWQFAHEGLYKCCTRWGDLNARPFEVSLKSFEGHMTFKPRKKAHINLCILGFYV